MANIYHSALEQKFTSIMEVIARQLDHADGLSGLTGDCRLNIQNLAEQAILEWTVERRYRPSAPIPVTNLQHLLHEYCSIADHI